MSGRDIDDDHRDGARRKGKGKGHKSGFVSKSAASSSSHLNQSQGKGSKKDKHKKGSKSSTTVRKSSDKDAKEDRKHELRHRPQIFLTPEKKTSIAYVLSQIVHKTYTGLNTNNAAAQEFQKKFESNLAANEAAGNGKSHLSSSTTSTKTAKSTKSRSKNEKVNVGPGAGVDNNNAEAGFLDNLSKLAVKEKDSYVELFSEKPDPILDRQLKEELRKKGTEARYMHMQNYRRTLPAYECSMDVIDVINNNQVVVICGETGSGKTTQVSQYILDDAISKDKGSTCKILCTQPRRISAISVAERVAEERGESVGKSVGYSIRLEAKLPSRSAGTITFVTTGVVFQYLKEDPNLSRISTIIVDEVHERDILTDFLLAILKDLVTRRSDIKVILMSATLNAAKFSEYFNKCAVFTIPGLVYPVTEYYLEDAITQTKFTIQQKNRVQFNARPGKPSARTSKPLIDFEKFIHPYIRKIESGKLYPRETTRQLLKPESEDLNLDLIQATIEHICQEENNNGVKDYGAILVFMPGWDTISSLHKQLQNCGKFPYNRFILIPLHSLVPTVNQREIFNKPPPGKRKIIISTNIAETSITIDDVVYVIDCGKIKMNNFDHKKNMETLDLEWVSLANGKQRKGRAGRVREGVCYHLYTKAREAELEEFKKPEILRKRLEEVILQIKMLKLGDATTFLKKLMDIPREEAIKLGLERLISLNALDTQEKLTPLGFHLAHLPMDPQTGKMILFGAIFSCIDPIFSIAASLTFKDAFYVPMGQERKVDAVRVNLSEGTKSDHMVTVKAIEGYEKARARTVERDYCYKNYLSQSNLNMLLNLKSQFATYLYRMKFLPSTDYKNEECNRNSKNVGVITGVAAAGLYPNVASVRMKGKKNPYPLVYTDEDGLVHIHPKSVNSRELSFECPFLVYHCKMKSSMIFLHDTTMVSPFPLVFFGGGLEYVKEKGYGGTIVIDNGRIRFGCMEAQVFNIIDSLRKELDKFLEHKVNNPGPTNWAPLSKEGALLDAIIQLITAEYKMLMNNDDDDNTTSDEDPGNDYFISRI